jgi:plasmid replication initiation protein
MEQREYKVVKSNDLIQKARFNLSLQEQKIIIYLISRIKPEDMELKEHEFEIADFCRLCGLDDDSGGNYKYIKQSLKDLRDKSVWIQIDENTETTMAWVDKVTITRKSGIVKIKIDDMLKPYLLHLQEKFTQYELLYTLAMKSQYSIRLYEILKSYEYRHSHTFAIEELKKRLNAEIYDRFNDFQCKALNIAIREINEVSDLNITLTLVKEGRRYKSAKFDVKLKKDIDKRLQTWKRIEQKLGGNKRV